MPPRSWMPSTRKTLPISRVAGTAARHRGAGRRAAHALGVVELHQPEAARAEHGNRQASEVRAAEPEGHRAGVPEPRPGGPGGGRGPVAELDGDEVAGHRAMRRGGRTAAARRYRGLAGMEGAAEDLPVGAPAQRGHARVPDRIVVRIVAQVVSVADIVGPGAGQVRRERGRYLVHRIDRVYLQLVRVTAPVAGVEHERAGHPDGIAE